ncbi:glycosyltransferase [Empedobacter brevis]|uniref:glycosyltransferase n=1 Tax=Empedobacter brevis TaxID=247 RepID=UPI0039B115C4
MKIYHIINSLNLGGAERLVVDMCKEMSFSDNEINLILLSNSKSNLIDEVKANKNIKLINLKNKNLFNIKILFQLNKYIKDADIIHLHLFPTLYWGVFYRLFFMKRKSKLFFTEHSTENNRRNKIYLKFIEKKVYSSLDRVICISSSTKSNLINHLGKKFEKKCVVINNGIDLLKFQNSSSYKKEDFNFNINDFILIQIASFRLAKDQLTVIKSLKKLPTQVKLLLVGDGSERSNIENLINQLDLEDRVILLGNRPDIPELVNMCDVVIVSSNYEGFGIAAVEGMACGKPIVASDVAGLSEIVSEYGILFPKGNIDKLAFIINRLIKDELFYLKKSKLCLDRANNYSIGTVVERYLSEYKK